jgi:hypothetical protein
MKPEKGKSMSRQRFYTDPHIIANPDPASAAEGQLFIDFANEGARQARRKRRAERQAYNAAVRAKRAEAEQDKAWLDYEPLPPPPQAVCLSLLRHWRCQKPAQRAASSNEESDDAR